MKNKYKMIFALQQYSVIRIFAVLLICFFTALPGFAQQTHVITGNVKDSIGGPLIGATVKIAGSKTGTITDTNGDFKLSVPNGSINLEVTYVGYLPQKISLGDKNYINIVLSEVSKTLDELVVVGYVTQKKATLTGSVSSIKNDELVVTKNENMVNMLTGKLPGVRVVQQSSQPGDYATTMDIRGMGTPLFVVDGVPRDQAYFSRMDAEEIDNISILKDGAASIYGLRAANGVVLITTKSGTSQNGKVDITYTSSYIMQQGIYVPHGINAQDYMTLRNEQNYQDFGGNYLIRRNPVFTQVQLQPYIDGTKQSYDWMRAVFNPTSPEQQHNLSINGGNDKLRYFFSLGYGKQMGNYTSGGLYSDNLNLRSNIDAQITKGLKARISIGSILTQTHQVNGADWSTYKETWLLRPDTPIYANDNPLYPNGDATLSSGNNMLVKTDPSKVGYNINMERRMNGTLQLTYDIPGITGLSAKGSYDYALSLPDYTQYKNTYNLYAYQKQDSTYLAVPKNAPAGVRRQANYNKDTDMQLGLYYSNKFGKHNINSFVLFEEIYSSWDNFSAYRDLKINSEYLFAGEDLNQQAIGGTPGDRLSQSVAGSLTYDYSGKYLLDFKFRYDGSSHFPEGKRFGLFPSVSAGWRISEEHFIKDNLSVISNLKLRASYGEMGDDGMANNYPPQLGYSLSSNVGWYFSNSLSGGVSASPIPNKDLTWYKSKIYNLGLDFGVLKNKLTGTFEVYRRDRAGILTNSAAVIPATVGATLPQINLNSDRNFGWELSLSYHNHINDFNYYVSPNIASTRRMSTFTLETPAGNSYDQWKNRNSGRYNNIWWGTQSGGMFTTYDQIRNNSIPQGQGTVPGDWWNVDWNGDGVVDGNDNHPLATTGLPVFTYGINTGASWKNFDLAMNFQGAYGVYVQYTEVLAEALSFGGSNTLSWFLDRWHPVDPNADMFNSNTQWNPGYYPVTGHDGRRTGTNSIQNASYIRLKTMELGYTLPKQLTGKVGVKSLRVYVNAYNLLTFSGLNNVDPERPGAAGGASTNSVQEYNYPICRTFTLGASIKF